MSRQKITKPPPKKEQAKEEQAKEEQTQLKKWTKKTLDEFHNKKLPLSQMPDEDVKYFLSGLHLYHKNETVVISLFQQIQKNKEERARAREERQAMRQEEYNRRKPTSAEISQNHWSASLVLLTFTIMVLNLVTILTTFFLSQKKWEDSTKNITIIIAIVAVIFIPLVVGCCWIRPRLNIQAFQLDAQIDDSSNQTR